MGKINEHIKFLSESYFDPIGRVFFAEGRVFRAIEPAYEQTTKEFLDSALFNELEERKWMVKTWVTNDVQIDGYNLILEHEKVQCLSPSVWTFTQLRDVLLFNLEIDELCKKYGKRLRDARYSNFTFVNGHPIFLDFGSLVGDLDCYLEKDFYLLVYPPLYLYAKREFMLYRAWQEHVLTYYRADQMVPAKALEDCLISANVYGHLIKAYDVYVRQRYPHVKFFTRFGFTLLRIINRIARKILQKDSYWNLFKYEAIYKNPTAKIVNEIMCPYAPLDGYAYTLEKIDVDKACEEISSISPCESILLYGNYEFEDVRNLRSHLSCSLIVASNDYIYADRMYKMAKEQNLNMQVVCFNLLNESDESVLKDLSSDVIVVNERFKELKGMTYNSSPKLLSQCHNISKYLYVVDQDLVTDMISIKGFATNYIKTNKLNIWKSI